MAKPFQCSTCNRGYVTAAALTAHMQGHKLQNQLAKKLKHFQKYQANCLPGLVPVDLLNSIVNCSQQLQQTAVSPALPGLSNGLNSAALANGALSPNSNTPFLPALNQPSLPMPSNGHLTPNPLLNPLLNPLMMNNSLLPGHDLPSSHLTSQLNLNLMNSMAKENELFSQQLADDQRLTSERHLIASSSPSPLTAPNGTKRSIVDVDLDGEEQANCKRLRTSSISEKDENSCSNSSFNSVNRSSLGDEEEVDVTSFEDEEDEEDQRSNSVNSLLSNSLSSSANSSGERSNMASLNGDSNGQPANSGTIKKPSADKQKKYACRFCSSHFDYKRSCDRHEKSIHTGERKFQCNECPNRYSR